MKNVVIGLLALTVTVMGFLIFSNNSSNNTGTNDDQSSSTTTDIENSESSSGETLDFSDKGLSEVPQDILDNNSVTVLDVSGNNLTGALPAEIRKLTNLEVLNASDNNMTGIPAEIGQLSKLRIANFANNDISGLPQEIGNLSNLETLDLRGNPNVSEFDISQIQPKIPNAKILTD